MKKERLRIIIGENIRKERISRNISIDELAEMLELTPGFVGLIERGQRGTTPSTLLKLADIFSTTIDSFFRSKDQNFGGSNKRPENPKREKILSLVSDFSEKEMEFLISVVKSLRIMNRPRTVEGNLDDFPQEDDE